MNERALEILVTGFGPFPGVPVNVSSSLAAEIAAALNSRKGHRIARSVSLPTDWVEGPAFCSKAIDELRPRHVLLLGVSRKARSLVIETLARNRMRAADAAGQVPETERIAADGPLFRTARWNSRRLVRAVRCKRLPAIRSRHAGTYLCNRLLYEVLSMRRERPWLQTAGFMHIPASLADPDFGQRRLGTPLTWEQAFNGGLVVADQICRSQCADV